MSGEGIVTSEAWQRIDVTPPRHPSEAALLRYFEFGHLPAGKLRETSAMFHWLAHALVGGDLPSSGELTTGLRKLLEAKDCAVRAALD